MSEVNKEALPAYDMCFVCGKKNPIGLKLEFAVLDDAYTAYFTPDENHQSYDGIVHGGIISTLLDEIMGKYVWVLTGKPSFTARLEVRYRRHGEIGKQLRLEGRILKNKGKLYEVEGKLWQVDGEILIADGTAKVMCV